MQKDAENPPEKEKKLRVVHVAVREGLKRFELIERVLNPFEAFLLSLAPFNRQCST